MNWLIVLPILIPLISAAISFTIWKWPKAQRLLGLAGAVGMLMVSLALLQTVRQDGIQAVHTGGWPAPFGITLVADLFSAIMLVLAGLLAVVVVTYSMATIDSERERFGYYPILNVLLMGVNGAFLTGDIFNLFVWFEVLLISSFVLLALGGERNQMEGAIKYVTLNLLSSTLFLTSVGILYGIVGTLNMADLSQKLPAIASSGVITTVGMLFLVSFGIKAAIFPLFFWLPASYHTPPVAVTTIFAGLLTKVGVYAMIRVFTLIFSQDDGYTHIVILVIAGLTMVTGVLGAVAQYDMRRLLSFHIISQIGYLLMGLGLFTPLALAGAVFFMIHVVLAKSALFLVSGITHHVKGTFDLKKLGGLYKANPGLAVLFLVPALSLAGVPPLSGFFAKLALVQGGLEIKNYGIVAAALTVSVLTLYSMIKIWTEAFWKEPYPTSSQNNYGGHDNHSSHDTSEIKSKGNFRASNLLMLGPAITLAGLVVLIGLAAESVFSLASDAAEQLLDSTEYVNAVLGGAQ